MAEWARASTGRSRRSGSSGLSSCREASRAAMSPRRSVGCAPGASMSPAGSSPQRASRTPRKSPRSSRRSGMRMYDLPDANGHFGPYGGVFVAETLTQALEELRAAYQRARNDAEFDAEFRYERSEERRVGK